MRRWMIVLSCLVISLVMGVETTEAQRGGGGEGGRGGRGGGRGGGVSPSQILGILAFDEQAAVTNDQLVKLREALKPVNVKQNELMATVRSGERDFQDVREEMMALRGEVLTAVSAVLSESQVKILKERMQRQGRGGRGGGGNRQR